MIDFKVKIFADGAEKIGMFEMYRNPLISGLTTNPTLMRKAGVHNYKAFALDILSEITEKPISFEVFADDLPTMERQAFEIASWGENVYVKIPITNTRGESTATLVRKLSNAGVRTNITAIMTIEQVKHITPCLVKSPSAFVSVFAGRIADAGIDPLPIMKEIVDYLKAFPKVELIWASPRELLNIIQANDIGCHVITVTNDILKKLPTIGKDLKQFSLETVKMFYDDAVNAGYDLPAEQIKLPLAAHS